MPASLTISNVAVFCASADGTNPLYRNAAEALGKELAARGIGLIYGGARVGLMRAVAEGALAAGGHVVGVIPEVLVDLEVAHDGLSELHITSTMHTRKALMGERSDAFIILPGGYGTFEEMFEVLAWQTLKLHDKPVILLNIAGFYDKMLDFLDHCVTEGVLKPKNRSLPPAWLRRSKTSSRCSADPDSLLFDRQHQAVASRLMDSEEMANAARC